MIQIAPNSYFVPSDPNKTPPEAATSEKAKELLEKFKSDLELDKFDKEDMSFDGYENYLTKIIRDGGIHPAFPPYPKFK